MSDIPPPRSGTAGLRWKTIGFICLVFILGMLTGLGGGAVVLRKVMQSKLTGGRINMPLLDHAEREITAKLHLTAIEKAAVGSELEITRSQITGRRQEMLAHLREIADDTLARIKTHLPEEKQLQLDQEARKRFTPWGILQPDK